MSLFNCYRDNDGIIRCSSCRHAVRIHKPSKQGYNHINGYCSARYCNCSIPFEQMGILEI